MAHTTTISHPSIGSITASTSKPGVVQLLGVQYATLKDRFSQPVMKEYGPNDPLNATKVGLVAMSQLRASPNTLTAMVHRPQVLSIAPNADPEFGLIQHTLDYDRSAFTQSDTEGLCLNITIPAFTNCVIVEEAKLPVFVFIHGGGFMVGSGMYPQYDMAKFVRLSIEAGMPCIAVTMKYGRPRHFSV
jgi:hypothetical protein